MAKKYIIHGLLKIIFSEPRDKKKTLTYVRQFEKFYHFLYMTPKLTKRRIGHTVDSFDPFGSGC